MKYRPVGRALCIFSSSNPLRKLLAKMVQSGAFEVIVLLLIVFSSCLLALENPLHNQNDRSALAMMDIVTTCLFVLELVLKNVAYGFIFNGKNSYMRNWWNIMDFAIVVVSVISITASSGGGLSSLKILRMLRVLRPLRMISRNQGLKVAVQALVMAVPKIINVLMVSLVFYLVYAIFFVSFFKDLYYVCDLQTVDTTMRHLVQDKWACLDLGGVWENQNSNFDNVGNGMVTLFEMATVGFLHSMFRAVDARGLNLQPEENAYPLWILLFISFIIIGKFLLINLFVGVVVQAFNRTQEQQGKDFMLTDA